MDSRSVDSFFICLVRSAIQAKSLIACIILDSFSIRLGAPLVSGAESVQLLQNKPCVQCTGTSHTAIDQQDTAEEQCQLQSQRKRQS